MSEDSMTIVIPTYDEAENVRPLTSRLRPLSSGRQVTLLFVDDSPDVGTILAVEEAACCFGSSDFQVGHFRRKGKKRWGGLAGAVTDGLRISSTELVVVMDGDLQHPPAVVSSLVELLDQHDLVVASRYCAGGTAEGLNGPARRLVSRASTQAAKCLFPRTLKHVSDPMTGFFAVRRSAIDLDRLRPQGFKILLEILARHPDLRVCEVPFAFSSRQAGASKGSVGQGMRFLWHLGRLRCAASRPSGQRRRPSSLTESRIRV